MIAGPLSILAGLAALATAAAPDLSGSGHILILDGSEGIGTNQTAADAVGCLNAEGFVTLDDCAVFSDVTSRPKTSEGECNYQDEAQPLNVDSIYGQGDNGYHCYVGAEASPFQWYSIDGFNNAYMCNGNIDCFGDIPKIPEAGEELPLWEFRWGSQQLDITPGHFKAMFLWDKVE